MRKIIMTKVKQENEWKGKQMRKIIIVTGK